MDDLKRHGYKDVIGLGNSDYSNQEPRIIQPGDAFFDLSTRQIEDKTNI